VCRTGTWGGSVTCTCGAPGDTASWPRPAGTSWCRPPPRPSPRLNRYCSMLVCPRLTNECVLIKLFLHLFILFIYFINISVFHLNVKVLVLLARDNIPWAGYYNVVTSVSSLPPLLLHPLLPSSPPPSSPPPPHPGGVWSELHLRDPAQRDGAGVRRGKLRTPGARKL